jgi:D-glycero-alpha-D-manno-heptose 1-phosphate guanylyltransferase
MMREAIILAGGKGSRLRGVVSDVPKPMAPINGRPFLEFLLDKLIQFKFNRVILSVGYMGDLILKHFGDSYKGLPITYVYESTPLGTGGGIRKSLAQLESDRALVLNGDTYADIDYGEMLELSSEKNSLVLGLAKVSNVARYGSVDIDDNLLIGFKEKGVEGPGLINVGSYIIGKNDLDDFSDNVNFSFEEDFLQKIYKSRPILVYDFYGKFIDIGVPEDFLLAQSYLEDA